MTVSLGSCPDSHFLHIFLIREFRLDCRGAVEKRLSSFNGIQEIGNDPRLSYFTAYFHHRNGDIRDFGFSEPD